MLALLRERDLKVPYDIVPVNEAYDVLKFSIERVFTATRFKLCSIPELYTESYK